jgi:hypothetical protein
MKSAYASFVRRTSPGISALLIALSCVGFLFPVSSRAQKDHPTAISRQAQNLALIPIRFQPLLSSAQERILYLNSVLQGSRTGDKNAFAAAAPAVAPLAAAGTIPGPYLRVSDPRLDFGNSVMTSFTQSESSSAWCGNSVVVGYNDSGAFARTAGVNFNGAWSFSSVSYSQDRGATFTEAGYLNPGSNPVNFLAGDPVVACTSPSQFYYSSIYSSGQDAAGNFFNGVAVNSSSDGGKTWGPPVAAVAKDFSHTIDKPWIAADPTNANRLFVTYTDFDFSGLICANDIRYAIELVVSGDGGATWSSPVAVLRHRRFQCGVRVQSGGCRRRHAVRRIRVLPRGPSQQRDPCRIIPGSWPKLSLRPEGFRCLAERKPGTPAGWFSQ